MPFFPQALARPWARGLALALGLGFAAWASPALAAGPNTPANTLRMAIHQFSVDHQDRFPADAREVMAEVVWAKDLFPPNQRAAALVFEAKPGEGRVQLGPATSATDAKREQTDPGALSYRLDAVAKTFYLFETQVQGGQAYQVMVVKGG